MDALGVKSGIDGWMTTNRMTTNPGPGPTVEQLAVIQQIGEVEESRLMEI